MLTRLLRTLPNLALPQQTITKSARVTRFCASPIKRLSGGKIGGYLRCWHTRTSRNVLETKRIADLARGYLRSGEVCTMLSLVVSTPRPERPSELANVKRSTLHS